MRNRRFVAFLGVVGLAAAGVVGCGSSSSSTSSPGSVQSALRATANSSGLKLTLSLSGNPPTSTSNNRSSGLTKAQEEAIFASTLSLTVHAASGSDLANAGTGGEVALTLSHSGNTLAELRVVGSTAYGRIDIQQFTSTYGLNKGTVARVQSELNNLGSRVAGLKELNNGQWVSVDLNQLNQLTQMAGITLPSVPQLVGRLVGAFFNNLAQTANIGNVHNGQAQLTVNARSVVTAVVQAVVATPGVSTFGKQINSLAQRAGNAIPANASGQVTVTVANGIVSNLELPLNQFEKHPSSQPMSVKLAVATAGGVSAPSGATAINIPQLIGALQSQSSNSSSNP